MPGIINFGIEGARAMEALLEQLGPNVARRVGDRALRAAAKPVVAEAKRLVPVRTGALREAITAQAPRRRQDLARVILIGFEKPHSRRAHLAEFGTRHAPATPFLRPALDSQVGEVLKELGRVLAAGITREAEKLAR